VSHGQSDFAAHGSFIVPECGMISSFGEIPMHASHSSPATHAGPWIDQTARIYARTSGDGRAWAPEEEDAMERSLRRPRVVTLHLAMLNVEISLRSRRHVRRRAELLDLYEHERTVRTLAGERETAMARWMLGG
jgi:hypothetical protein